MRQSLIYIITLPFRAVIALFVALPMVIAKILLKNPAETSQKFQHEGNFELLKVTIKNTKLSSGVYLLSEVPISSIEDAILAKLPENAELDGHGSDGEDLDIFIYCDSAQEVLEQVTPAFQTFEIKYIRVTIVHADQSEQTKDIKIT